MIGIEEEKITEEESNDLLDHGYIVDPGVQYKIIRLN